MLKKLSLFIAFLLVVSLVSIVPQETEASPLPVHLELNGKKLTNFDVPPTIIDSRTYLPYRAILEALGAKVEWDAPTKTAIAQKDGVTIKVPIGQKYIQVGEYKLTMDVPNRIVGNRTMIPVRYIAQALGSSVEWNGETRTVKMTLAPQDMLNQFLTGKSGDATVDFDYADILYTWLTVYKDKLPEFNGKEKVCRAWNGNVINCYSNSYDGLKGNKEIDNFTKKVASDLYRNYSERRYLTISEGSAIETGKYRISKLDLYQITQTPVEGWIKTEHGGNYLPDYTDPNPIMHMYQVWDTTLTPPQYSDFPAVVVHYYLPKY